MRLYEIFKREPVNRSLPYDSGETPLARMEPWRGPHEGRLVTLMLAGKKPAAWADEIDIDAFKPYIKDGTFIAHDFDYGDRYPHPGWVITLPGEEWRAAKLQKIYNNSKKYKEAGKENLWHARVGMLLGYSNEDIRKFITQD